MSFVNWKELSHVFDEVGIETDVHNLFLELCAFLHHLYCFFEVLFCLFIFFNQLRDLFILRTDNLFKFCLLIFYSFELFLIVLLEVGEMTLSYNIKLFSNLFTIDIVLHLKAFRLSLHFLHPRL